MLALTTWLCFLFLRVETFHTYFVGSREWGFSVWAHNAYTVRGEEPVPSVVQDELTLNETHVFEGEINNRGRAVGFHYREGGLDTPTARMTSLEAAPNAQGVYRGRVEIFDPATNTWVSKNAPSTFFPDSWSPSEVRLNIMEAYSNPLPRQAHWQANYWEGVSQTTGVRVGGYLDPHGNLATAFPIY